MNMWDTLIEAFKPNGNGNGNGAGVIQTKPHTPEAVTVTAQVYKGLPVWVCQYQSSNGLSGKAVDCRGFNAVHVEVFPNGTSPSATLSIEGSTEEGGNYLPLPDPGARRLAVTTPLAFDVPCGAAWARVRIANISGTLGNNEGFTIILTPYIAPSLLNSPIVEGGLTELIDQNDTEVSQNDYSKSVSVALGSLYSGKIKQISLYATELGTGAVRANSGYLLIFDADPALSAGATALSVAQWQSCIAKVLVTDWISDAGGGMATMEVDVRFHALDTLYFVFQNLGTAYNDAAGDDEELHMNFWFDRKT